MLTDSTQRCSDKIPTLRTSPGSTKEVATPQLRLITTLLLAMSDACETWMVDTCVTDDLDQTPNRAYSK